jgi:hypothetical protein
MPGDLSRDSLIVDIGSVKLYVLTKRYGRLGTTGFPGVFQKDVCAQRTGRVKQ